MPPGRPRKTNGATNVSELEIRERVQEEIARLEEVKPDLDHVQGAMQDPDLPRALRVEFGQSFLHPSYERLSNITFYLRYVLEQPRLPGHEEIEGAFEASSHLVDDLVIWQERVELAWKEALNEPAKRPTKKLRCLLQAYDPFAPIEPWLLVTLSVRNKRQNNCL